MLLTKSGAHRLDLQICQRNRAVGVAALLPLLDDGSTAGAHVDGVERREDTSTDPLPDPFGLKH